MIYLGLDSTWQVKEGRKEGRQGRSGGWEEGRRWENRVGRRNGKTERKGKNCDKE